MYRLDSGGDGAGLFNNMVNVPPCRHDPKTEFPDCVDTNTCCREGQLLDGSCGGFKPLTLEQMTDQECSRRAPVGADVSYNQYNCYGNDSPACLWDAKAKKCIPKPKSMDFDVCEFIHRTSSQNGSVDIEQCKHGSHGCKVSMFGYQQGCEKK